VFRSAVFVALLAMALRGGAIVQYERTGIAHHLISDAERYDRLARELLEHGPIPRRAFDQAPAYPYLLAAVYRVAGGPSPSAVRWMQAVADTATVVLLMVVARRLFGAPAALATGLLGALCGAEVFLALRLGKESLVLLFLALVLLALHPAGPPRGEATGWRGLAAGAALGAAALLRENLIVALPFLVVLLLRGRRARGAVAAVLGCGLALLPFAALNVAAGGEPLLTSAQAGRNLLVGNRRGADGSFTPFGRGSQDPEQEIRDMEAEAAAVLARETGEPVAAETLSARRVSRILAGEAWREIRADPGAWARLLVRKGLLFWNHVEIPDTESLAVTRERVPVLRAAPVGFGLVAVLAVIGLALVPAAERRAALGLVLVVLAILVSLLPFFVIDRYRLPALVPLLPLAGAAVAAAARWRAISRRRLALAAVLGALAAAVVWAPLVPAASRRAHQAVARYNLAVGEVEWAARTVVAEAADQRLIRALAALDAADATGVELPAVRLVRAVAWHRRGVLALVAGRTEEALRRLERAKMALDEATAVATAENGLLAEIATVAPALAANTEVARARAVERER
jgi:4-amino-4-deoxy-L-arabinose transferase-like glycosyltransferase